MRVCRFVRRKWAKRRERHFEMADVSEETYGVESWRSKYRRDRTERRDGRRVNRFDAVSAVDSSPSSRTPTELKNHENDEATVVNDVSSSTDRETARRERRAERRKAKEEAESKPVEESPCVEGAAAAEEDTPKKSLKKERKGDNSARKRKDRKNLREKRRSTGVVIMPNMDVSFKIFYLSCCLGYS